MPGKKPAAITGREFAILKLLWEQGPLSVREIRERLSGGEKTPYTSILSLLQLMERKGYLRHKAEGKTYLYAARVGRRATTGLVLRDFVGRFFDGSVESLVMGLAESSELTPEVWEQLQEELREREGEGEEER